MKKNAVPLVLVMVAISGCANPMVVRTITGNEYIAMTKPKLTEDGYYTFNDKYGTEVKVKEAQVESVQTYRAK